MEGNRERSVERPISSETEATLNHPERVFDSPKTEADEEFRLFLNRILELLKRSQGEVYRHQGNTELRITLEKGEQTRPAGPVIQIVWPAGENQAQALTLKPLMMGKGPEAGIYAFTGVYGTAKRTDKGWEMEDGKTQTLEQLYDSPNGARLLVKPTVDRWAVGPDEMYENSFELYMGLGFLYLNRGWMYIGFHETGHLPHTNDENEAWTKAKIEYKKKHKGSERTIIEGKSTGLFGILKRPELYTDRPTMGMVEKYGIVSHYLGGNARIPKHWEQKAQDIYSEFRRTIKNAQGAFKSMMGMY